MPVAHLLASMDSQEFAEWMAYFKVLDDQRREQEMAARAEAGLQKAHGMVRKWQR